MYILIKNMPLADVYTKHELTCIYHRDMCADPPKPHFASDSQEEPASQ